MADYVERKPLNDSCYEIFEETVRAGKDMTASEVRQLLLRFEKAIQTAPAADVAPVRHAKWGVEVGMNLFKERNCPVCKRRIESNFWNYCPNCGARMDGDSDA